jgi:hypothetical protein
MYMHGALVGANGLLCTDFSSISTSRTLYRERDAD